MTTTIGFEDSFDISYFCVSKWNLGIIGFWPLDPLNRITKIKIVLNTSLLVTAIIGELRSAWFMRRDPLSALDVICPCMSLTVTLIKLICFLKHRRNLELTLKRLYKHCKAETTNFKKNSLIAKVSYFTKIWCQLFYINGLSISSLFAVKPLLAWSYQFLVNGNNNTWVELPFPAALPYEDMTRINSKILYSFIYGFLAHSGTVNILGVSGTDGAFLCFCMYISVSYQCLQEDFKSTFKNHIVEDSYPGNNDVLYTNLTDLIKRQQSLMEIFKSFNRTFKLVVFVHFAFASIILGIVLVNFRLIPGLSKLVYLIYGIGAGNQLFMYCYGAESVNKNCLKVAEVLYFCDWYKCDKKVQLLILFVLVKSQRGSSIKAPFFSPSLQLFSSIIQTSGSYFSILLAVL